ncbi:hypothetical protein IE81DRAFT_12590 [Ceraceosorus guamensis]|uniref:Structure-specific endonuclease subunit SLX4 n=1 Tax=Ceraceosorus guamensis TaxID=1522189 RepID=A0A316W3X4_9BASI|nr:hypothetical protein IE81DRAFT_12590 [Ceraceosorus guamensis]PWN44617.1 hypothetical protein IE81DRAFT_12590 [Ceraceosorus guamensis]
MGLLDELDALGGASTGRSSNSNIVRKQPSMTNQPLSKRARRDTKDDAGSTVRDAILDPDKCAAGGAERVIETIEIEDSPIRPATNGTNTDASGEMPKYVSWSLEALQTECKKYGFKAGRDKDVLVEHLIACWRVLNHSAPSKNASVSSPLTERQAHQALPLPSSSAGDTTATTSQWSLGVANGEEAEAGDLTVQLTNEAAASSQQIDVIDSSSDTEASASSAEDSEAPLALGLNRRASGSRFRRQVEARAMGQTTRGGQNDEEGEDSDEGEPENAPVDVSASLSAQLVQAVRADAQLYRRILLLEPISFDEVASVALKAHIRLKNKDVLRDWLDMQGICFYTGELTGTRSRY